MAAFIFTNISFLKIARFTLACLLFSSICHAGKAPFTSVNLIPSFDKNEKRIDPPNWWVGMPDTRLQLLIHDDNISNSRISFSDSRIKLIKMDKLTHPDYLSIWIDLKKIKSATAFNIFLKKNNQQRNYNYQLLARQKETHTGLRGSDLIYLIMPDRFSNGNPENDKVEGMQQTEVNRKEMYERHGGDLEGIIKHLNYLQHTGISTLWLNPVQENDQPKTSYHGYAITDHYKIDPRLGRNEDYKRLSDSLHQRGMKLIMDVVLNHCGNQHYFIRNLPEKNWIHQWDTFTKTSYNGLPLMDPNAHENDRKQLIEGWFDHHMPDLHQDHPVLKQFLIQYSIWWCEYAQLDGLRVDTWYYSDQNFMQEWLRAIRHYNSQLTIFSESWVQGCGVQAFFNAESYLGKNPPLVSPIDFQVAFSMHEALTKPYSWDGGISRLHSTLSQDYLFRQPNQHLIFLDNHDMSRIYSILGEDLSKWKQAIAMLMTLRGIPSVYYGTEILMKNFSDPDGKVREDFPGGWEGDSLSCFQTQNIPVDRKSAYQFFQQLAQFRKSRSHFFDHAQMIQWLPKNGLYACCRKTNDRLLLLMINTDKNPLEKDFNGLLPIQEGHKVWDVIEQKSVHVSKKIKVPGNGLVLLEFILN